MDNQIIESAKAQIIALIKSSGVTRITKFDLEQNIENFKVMTQAYRALTTDEKNALLLELSTHYTADLNYSTDLVVLERGLAVCDTDPTLHEEWTPDTNNRFYWRKQREFLMDVITKRDTPSVASLIINSIDYETEEILKNI
jgi:hypothetical protein